MLETVRSAVRRLSKISNYAFKCDYYYYYYYYYSIIQYTHNHERLLTVLDGNVFNHNIKHNAVMETGGVLSD